MKNIYNISYKILFNNKMIILITGVSGFLGSNLLEELIKDKTNYIIGIDNNSTGNMDNISKFMNNGRFEFIKHDINNTPSRSLIDRKIEQIYHLACPASPKKYQKNPINTIKTNVLGTGNMLELAKHHRSRILLASTSEIYGEPEISPIPEEYNGNVNCLGIRACYDEGKRMSETMMMDYNRYYSIETRIVRIFNTYGKNLGKKDGRVISNFIYQALNNKDITIYGDGSQTRSFCYVDDLIDGIIKTMNSDYIYPINLGNPNDITINDLAIMIIKLTDSISNIVYCELPEDDPTNRKPDITKAIKILEWKPKINLEAGLIKFINYIKDNDKKKRNQFVDYNQILFEYKQIVLF